MKWIHSSVRLEEPIDAEQILQKIERACRTCYQSLDLVQEGSAEKLIKNCINRGHESILEHAVITYRVICDRAVMAEWTRHRMASYSIESTRYCNYTKDKFGGLTFIYPYWMPENPTLTPEQTLAWHYMYNAALHAEIAYKNLLHTGMIPDAARAILPNCLKTEIVCTMNLRELRHFLKLRTDRAAHPDIQKLAKELFELLKKSGLGLFFEDLETEE